ncbi:DUF6622 family protein [Vandammella animalimorsus]|nr:DUF6622 family protein [Vandammella animalimorsus]
MTAAELITHTPLWVWPLLAALLALGWMQTRARRVSLARALALPLVMLILTPATLAARWAATDSMAVALAVWSASALLVALIGRRRALRPGEHFDAAMRRLHLAGSWAPLWVILGIFCLRYAVAATQAVNPALAAQPAFALTAAALGGALNGWLMARAWALWMLARSSM